MNFNKAEETLEFNIILEKLNELSLTDGGSKKILALRPFLSESAVKSKLDETTNAKKVIDTLGSPPISAMKDIKSIIEKSEKGGMLTPSELENIGLFISSTVRMIKYLKKSEEISESISSFRHGFTDLEFILLEINNCIRNSKVDDNATPTLKNIRKKIESTSSNIKTKLESILNSKKKYLADSYIVTRGERNVLPVKKEYKSQVPGTVVDKSSTGSTLFIEPNQVTKIVDELALMKIDEDNEVRKILYTLSAFVVDNSESFKSNIMFMEDLDFVFAKGKLSLSMDGVEPEISAERTINIIKGRHPLLNKEECVPIDFKIGGDVTGVVITGPNTGGKTVALKTIGLLSTMVQSGLHVPVDEKSKFTLNNKVYCDIGDGQSISQNLSTFSSHIKNVIEILEDVSDESLVLLDELGSGTDPAEGMGIAVAIIEALKNSGTLFVVTTHYPEIKEFAKKTEKLINARMEFDQESLKPLYKLVIGEAGKSCALHIAKKLGFPSELLNIAYKEAYTTSENFVEEVVMERKKKPRQIRKIEEKKIVENLEDKFVIGDSVMVTPSKDLGIVYKPVNDKGEVVVQIKGEKITFNHKRVKVVAKASDLYPPDYDFSIIFDTVENRKIRHKMTKKHDDSLIITEE